MKNTQPHPYYIMDRLEQIRNRRAGLSADEMRQLKASVAVNAADPAAVAAYANLHGENWLEFYPPAPQTPQPDTNSAISTFLNTYGGGSDRETSLLERLIFNPTPDYATVLAKEETQRREHQQPDLSQPGATDTTEPADSQDALLAAFIASHPDGETVPEPPAEINIPEPKAAERETPRTRTPERQPSSLSESLAKVYIRQGRYRQAYDIISQLNLKFPEKSIYFADQLRFLRKLMLLKGQ